MPLKPAATPMACATAALTKNAAFVQAMDTSNDSTLPLWDSGLRIVRDELHHHFYANHLSASEAANPLALGRAFVERLIRISEMPGNQAGTT